MNRLGEIVFFKLAEFLVVLLFVSVLFWLIPSLAFVTDKFRSFQSIIVSSFFVLTIFYFLLLFGPVSAYILSKVHEFAYSNLVSAFVNALVFFIYAISMAYIFSQQSVRSSVIISIAIVSLVVLAFGWIFFSLRYRAPSA